MKIDNDLIRIMLLQVELDVDGMVNYEIENYCEDRFSECPDKAIYHMKYLIDAQLVQARNGFLRDLTPAGHDILKNIREITCGQKPKKL